MPCDRHKEAKDVKDSDDCPECKKAEKFAAALTRLRRAIVKAAEESKSPDAAAPKPATLPKPKIDSGPSLSTSMGGVSLSAGIPNPLAKR